MKDWLSIYESDKSIRILEAVLPRNFYYDEKEKDGTLIKNEKKLDGASSRGPNFNIRIFEFGAYAQCARFKNFDVYFSCDKICKWKKFFFSKMHTKRNENIRQKCYWWKIRIKLSVRDNWRYLFIFIIYTVPGQNDQIWIFISFNMVFKQRVAHSSLKEN